MGAGARPDPGTASVGRRTVIGGGAAVGVATWVAPAILRTQAAAAATPADGVVVVATGSSGTIITSPDAVTWTERTSTVTNNLKGVAYSPLLVLYAAVGSGGTIVTSPDGITWTQQTSPTPRELNAITWDAADARFVATGNAKTVVTSTDGVTWVLQTTGLVGDPDYLGVAADGAGTLVAVGTAGVADRSTDGGSTWSAGTSTVVTDLQAAAWFGDAALFAAVGTAGTAITSPDGVLWSLGSTGTTDDLVGVAWSDAVDEVVAVDGDAIGQVLRSSDGATWTSSALGGSIKAITWSPLLALFIAVGSSGSVWTSTSSSGPWTSQTTPVNQNLLAVVASA